MSNSSDQNNLSYSGQPLSMNYYHPPSSHSNSSQDVSVHGMNRNKKLEYKNHQSLKQTYSEQSLISLDSSSYELDFEKIKRAEDLRTTLMIKNIPNKYS